MAGMPVRRARRSMLPRTMNMVPITEKQFLVMDPAQQMQALTQLTMRQTFEVCTWDLRYLDTARLMLWNAVRHDLMLMRFRWGLEDRRSAERETVLRELTRSIPRRFNRKEIREDYDVAPPDYDTPMPEPPDD